MRALDERVVDMSTIHWALGGQCLRIVRLPSLFPFPLDLRSPLLWGGSPLTLLGRDAWGSVRSERCVLMFARGYRSDRPLADYID